jgi:hypothetical protein
VPEQAYITDVHASPRDVDVVYVAATNFQRGDFTPYLLKSTDRGRTWTSIAGDLPARHFVWSIVADEDRRNLLFAGTEFGLFFTIDGGGHWVPLKGGVPTIAFRDLEIQPREVDLVGATFGRGFYVLDDYTALRHITLDGLAAEGAIFPLRPAYLYSERTYTRAAWGNETTPNPPYGAVFTYYLRDALPPATGDRASQLLLVIRDATGQVVRTIEGKGERGLQRAAWDLRREPVVPPERPGTAAEEGGGSQRRAQPGPLVEPGKFSVALARKVGDQITPLGEQTFEVLALPR